MALVSARYPILMFMPTDEAAAGLQALAADLRAQGRGAVRDRRRRADPAVCRRSQPDHPDADAVCLIQSFYALAIRVAARRGTDVDRPRHLQKVTRTR